MEGAAGFEGALITEFLETPFAVVGGDEGGDGGGEFGAVAAALAAASAAAEIVAATNPFGL